MADATDLGAPDTSDEFAAPSSPEPEGEGEAVAVAVAVAVDPDRLTLWFGRRDPVRWILAAITGVWFLTFFILCKERHDRFGTFAFDLGTYDQGVWLLSHFKMFDTVRGLNILGHHLNLVLLLLAPFYRLGLGPEFLLFVQVAAQASGAAAIFLLARDRLGDRWLALILAAVLLLNPTYQFLTWEFFHPDSLAIAPLLFAYWAARAERWGWFVVAALLAVMCKEDVALAFVAFGLLLVLRRKPRIGASVVAAAGGWYFIATRVVMKHFLGGLNPFYDSYFGDLGSSFGDVLKNIVLRPGVTLNLVTQPDRVNYFLAMFAPVAFIALLSASTLLVALPMLAVNLLTTFPYARDYMYHYSALVLAGVMLATVEAIARIGRTTAIRHLMVGLVAACTVGATVAWGLSPISVLYNRGYWSPDNVALIATERAAMKVIPANASVSAVYNFVPHLTHRTQVYNFPEPWTRVNWGVNGEGLPDPGSVQWFAVDRTLLSASDTALVTRLLSTEFTTRFDRDDILVAQRTAPGGRVPYGVPNGLP